MKRPKWLLRDLIVGPYVCLVTSQAECNRAFKDAGLKETVPWIASDHSDASVHYFDNPKGEQCYVVAIRLRDGISGIQVAGLLTHEAVHIFQGFCERIGEHQPSKEFEAYSIQSISQRLLDAYAERLTP